MNVNCSYHYSNDTKEFVSLHYLLKVFLVWLHIQQCNIIDYITIYCFVIGG